MALQSRLLSSRLASWGIFRAFRGDVGQVAARPVKTRRLATCYFFGGVVLLDRISTRTRSNFQNVARRLLDKVLFTESSKWWRPMVEKSDFQRLQVESAAGSARRLLIEFKSIESTGSNEFNRNWNIVKYSCNHSQQSSFFPIAKNANCQIQRSAKSAQFRQLPSRLLYIFDLGSSRLHPAGLITQPRKQIIKVNNEVDSDKHSCQNSQQSSFFNSFL